MKNIVFFHPRLLLLIIICSVIIFGCERDIEDLQPAQFSKNPAIFIDGFSPGLNYAAFGGSVPTAFQVDNDVTYENSQASMRFEVPDVNDPRGAYAGGAFFTDVGRDLTGYTALTFWGKASQAADIDVVGFGNDLRESKYQVVLPALRMNTNWKKYIIPIPDPSKLTAERGMFFYSSGPINGRGYTFWIDELKFENLQTLAHSRHSIMNGENRVVEAEPGERVQITGLQSTFNLPTGIDQTTNISPAYFEFSTSNESVVVIRENGVAELVGTGTAVITAKVSGVDATGSLTLTSEGLTPRPEVPAPLPTRNPADVISMFSNAYDNVPIDTWNTRWEFSTAEEFFIKIENSDVIRYRNLNFVGIEFTSQTIDASGMTHFHLNIWTPDPTDPPRNFKVLLVDFGPDNAFGGGDDSSHELTFTRPLLTTGNWITIDITLSSFTGLVRRANLAQLVLSGDLPNVYVDNVYFYNAQSGGGGGPASPNTAAPTPVHNPSNVISIFSDAYSNIPGTDFNPNWGQATMVSQLNIGGSNTLRYGNLNYQGIQLGSNQNVSQMEFLHLDFWTSNSTSLEVFIISPGPVETPFRLTVPTNGWSSINIPISAFAPVDLTNVFQFKFEGNGNIYLDNIYFFK